MQLSSFLSTRHGTVPGRPYAFPCGQAPRAKGVSDKRWDPGCFLCASGTTDQPARDLVGRGGAGLAGNSGRAGRDGGCRQAQAQATETQEEAEFASDVRRAVPGSVSQLLHRPVGPPLCGNGGQSFCARPCLSDSDCIGTTSPYCYTGYTDRLTNEFTALVCVNGSTSICIDITPCG